MQDRFLFGSPWNLKGILRTSAESLRPAFSTPLGVLYNEDCLSVLPLIKDEKFDLVFADPPFNLGKLYGAKVDDRRAAASYVEWCYFWIDECIRILKPGGSFFLYNLPHWNIQLGHHLLARNMTFRDWIAVDIKFGLPIAGRLYPSHYSLLYFSKGKPKTFHSIRTPIKICRHCGRELKDYGGHREAMNPRGVNLTDVWADIPPVRHRKFKSEKRRANQLSTKLLTRVVLLSTNRGDLVLDPFGGAGTTFDVCERLGRHWVGIEIGECEAAIERLRAGNVKPHVCDDYVEELIAN
jgi:site-specific DNA-methyltransferase (adenine-specific)